MEGEGVAAGPGEGAAASEDGPDSRADSATGEDTPLDAAALDAARTLGPVFRLRPRDKRPLRKGWQDEATTDETAIAELWRVRPDANIGLACGVTAWALDIDGGAGLATLAALTARNGLLPGGPATITGSGGMHLFFAASFRVRNSVRRLGPGLDTRALGGLVVLPPSVHPNGNRYRWAPGRDWALPLPEAPDDWLIELLDPPQRTYRPATERRPVTTGYIAAALAAELDAIAAASEGTRNTILNRAAYSLGRFIVSADLDAGDLGNALVEAATAAGLPEREAVRTVRSGLEAAIASAQ